MLGQAGSIGKVYITLEPGTYGAARLRRVLQLARGRAPRHAVALGCALQDMLGARPSSARPAAWSLIAAMTRRDCRSSPAAPQSDRAEQYERAQVQGHVKSPGIEGQLTNPGAHPSASPHAQAAL